MIQAARTRRLAAALVLPTGLAAALVAGSPAATAGESGTLSGLPTPAHTDSADCSSPPTVGMWQTNGTVYRLAYANGNVFAAGPFTSVRPPCEPAGTDENPVQYLAAFNSSTGALNTGWATHTFTPNTNVPKSCNEWCRPGPIAMAVSPDGSTLYVGGNFTEVDGQPRDYLAAFDTSTGALLPWAPSASYYVTAMAVGPDNTVYFSGPFRVVSSTGVAFGGPVKCTTAPLSRCQRPGQLAAVTGYTSGTTGGVVLPWAPSVAPPSPSSSPTAPPSVFAMAVGNGQVYIGGNIAYIDGQATNAIGVVDDYYDAGADDGTGLTVEPFSADSAIPVPVCKLSNGDTYPAPCNAADSSGAWSQVKDIVPDPNNGDVYVGAEGTGLHVFDGTFAASMSSGDLVWMNGCLGASQALAVIGNWLYHGSHAHDCATFNDTTNGNGASYIDDPDDFPPVPAGGPHHLLAFSLSTGLIGPWYPDTNGNPLGPEAMATDGTSLWVGGDFTAVNGQPQQGLAWFQPGNARPDPPVAPVAVSLAPGTVDVYVQAPLDLDDTDMTIDIYRDGTAAGDLIATPTIDVHSLPWRQPVVEFTDTSSTGLSSGTHTYYARAVAADGVTGFVSAASAPVTVATAEPTGYLGTALGDVTTPDPPLPLPAPSLYWRLDEAAGSCPGQIYTPCQIAADVAGNLGGQYVIPKGGSISFGQPGALTGSGDNDPAVTLNGGWITSSCEYTTNLPPGSWESYDCAGITAPTSYSLAMWFKTTSTTASPVMGFADNAISNPVHYDREIYLSAKGAVTFYVWNGSVQSIASKTGYNNGGWHLVVATQSSSGMALYVDGSQVASNAVGSAYTYPNGGYWRVGDETLPGGSYPTAFKGSVDEVTVYPAALSSGQVSALYSAAH